MMRHQIRAIRPEHGFKVINLLAGLLVGVLMGTGFALLQAPQSGAETRRQIRGKAIELQNKTTQAVTDAQSRVGEVADRIAERAAELRPGGSADLTDTQRNVHRTLEEIPQASEPTYMGHTGGSDAVQNQ